ncbi:hypothetical protein HELRODRAFT_171296 [Helobdella robusta]|uniref:Phytanoyl-CoA hydroxylase-interacting protein-like C-terminal domain-containing protein n=1 Tax=Helobdella robusta TaxID=6412 RepID=T1F417_HELRO|nr:hypothetical protein HELRODRAFT_171296 [Helobdella robusta]ESO05637.1 hypothetical protein HELRODRAFT_171296 [Helobdella robusta]
MDDRFTKEDLKQLMNRATPHYQTGRLVLCKYLYRNKPLKYFEDIVNKRSSIMKTYVKDNSGDPRNPINGKLNGLFFLASVNKGSLTGEPKKTSQFGNTRLTVPVNILFDVHNCKLYFTDFFCMRGKEHFVTLVLTLENSEADRFCQEKLIPLNVFNNPFLMYDLHSASFRVPDCKIFTVEVFYTENVNLHSGKITKVKTIGNRRFSRKGVPKNPECSLCNLPYDSLRANSMLDAFIHLQM